MLTDLELDSPGIAQVLTSPAMAAAVQGLAARIAANVAVPESGVEVQVDTYTTDRAAAAVTIKHPQAQLWETRDGILTGAAGGAGVEVRAR